MELIDNWIPGIVVYGTGLMLQYLRHKSFQFRAPRWMRMLCLWGRNGDLNLRATTTQLYGVVYLITVGLYKGGALSTLVATVLIGLGLLLTMVVDTIIHLKHERARKDRKVHRVRKHR